MPSSLACLAPCLGTSAIYVVGFANDRIQPVHSPVLIVGGTTGIGAALGRSLVEAGRPVHVIGHDAARLQETAAKLGCTTSLADARDPEALTTAIAAAGTEGFTGLAYCVGSITLKPLAQTSAADLLDAVQLNAVGAAIAVKSAATLLRSDGDAAPGVVLFSTVAVRQGFANHATIALAKGAVEGLTLALAAELAPRIRVNCIAPSLTRTPLAARLTANEAMAKAIAGMHPMQRLGEAADAAALARFLLSAESGWITGQIIGVDGGRSTLRSRG